jgi:membrane-associated phospholipid phosphatase
VRAYEWILVGYLLYLAVLAWVMPLSAARRRLVTAVAVADIAVVWWMSGARSPLVSVARDWVPSLQILLCYWLSGAFYLRPMPRVEAWLASWDRKLFDGLGAGHVASRGPRILLEYFELAYLTVYFLIPLAFALPFFLAPGFDVTRYWTIVVVAELACYSALPWIQTRPPRALRLHAAIEDRRVAIHRLNGWVLGLGSIQVNTFPSGHAAGSFATALAVGEVVPSAFLPLLALAASITIGSVLGRYHYIADSVTGVMVAVAAWAIVR